MLVRRVRLVFERLKYTTRSHAPHRDVGKSRQRARLLHRTLVRVVLLTCSFSGVAQAADVGFLGADIGAAGVRRSGDGNDLSPRYGLLVGVRAELDKVVHARAEARYVDTRLFSTTDGERSFELSVSARSPSIRMVALDLHEFYVRKGAPSLADLLHVQPGVALAVRLGPFDMKGSVGYFGGKSGGIASADEHEERGFVSGAFTGGQALLRIKLLEASLRGSLFAVVDEGLVPGLFLDGDMMIRIPARHLAVGPRLDVMYKNLDIRKDANDLPGSRQLTVALSLGVVWNGTGRGADAAPGKLSEERHGQP